MPTNRRHLLIGATVSALAALISRPGRASDVWPALKDVIGDPDMYDVALSPDGTQIALLMRSGKTKIVAVHTLKDKTSRRLVLGDFDVRSVSWASDTHVMVNICRTTQTGSGLYSDLDQIITVDTRSGKNTLLYERQAGYSTAGASAVRIKTSGGYSLASVQAQKTIMAGPATIESLTNGGTTQTLAGFAHLVLNRIDLVNGFPIQIDRSEWGIGWAFRGDGSAVARADYIFTSNLFSLKFNINGDWKEVLSQKVPVLNVPRLLGLSHDGLGVIIDLGEDPQGEAEARWIELRPDGTQSPVALNGRKPSMVLHPVTRQMVGIRYDEDTTRYDFFDPVLQKVGFNAAKAMQGYRYRIVDWAEDPRKLLLYVEGADDAGTYYFADFTTAEVVAIGERHPHLNAAHLSEKQAVKVATADGLTLDTYLSLPAKGAKAPAVIVLPHEGPHSRDDLWFDPLVTVLTSRGYAVLQVNYRGSSGYGMGLVRRGYGEWGRRILSDLSDSVKQLGEKGLIDARRASILGTGPFSGYAALASVALEPDVYRCAIGISGIYDLEAWRNYIDISKGGRERYAGQYLRRSLGEATNLRAISPVRLVSRIQAPVLLMQLEKDSQVPPAQIRDMESALKSAAKVYETVKIRDQDRLWLNEAARLQTVESVLSFLSKYNPA